MDTECRRPPLDPGGSLARFTRSARGPRWKRAIRAAAALAALLAAAAPARAQDALLATVEALSGDVVSVTSAGRWHAGDAAGSYRVVVLGGGYEHVSNRLYVQWLRDADGQDPARAAATASIGELNDAGPYRFSCDVRAGRANELVVTVRATHVHTGQRVRFTVRATTPGTYRATRDAPPRTR